MLTVGAIVLGATDVAATAAFYRRALGYVDRYPPEADWASMAPADGIGPNISIGQSETGARPRPRVHLDLYADDQSAEVERLIELGASRVEWDDYPPDADFVVLADPAGNRFCVIDRSR